jgi:D-3-phosphoglycerate dehydrogenase
VSGERERPFRIVATSHGGNWDIEEGVVRASGDAAFAAVPAATEEELIAAGRGADAVLAGNERFTRRVIESYAGEGVRVISRPAVGFDQIDLDAATARGIVVTHVADYCTDEVSDHALALTLALHRRIPPLDRAVKAGRWARGPGYAGARPASYHAGERPGPAAPLRGQTLGIVGFGRIGRRVAEKARGFGLRLLACDPFLSPDAVTPYGATLVELDALLREADFVSLHCPLDAGTRGLIGAAQLARMKPTAALINTARGPLVDTAALVAALADGALAAAALDVTDPEPPPPEHPLLALPNLLLTPHSAYYSDRARAEVRRRAVEHALGVLRGRWPEGHVANPAVRERRAALREAGGAPPAERQG